VDAVVEVDSNATIDHYRPYGNSDVAQDVADLLGWEVLESGLTLDQRYAAAKMQEDMLIAIKIFLQKATLETGLYKITGCYGTNWEKV